MPGWEVYRSGLPDLAGAYLTDFDVARMELSLTSDERAEYEAAAAPFRRAARRFFRAYPGAGWRKLVQALGRTGHGRQVLAAWHRARDLVAGCAAKLRLLGTLLEQYARHRCLVSTSTNAAAYAVAERHLIMPLTREISRRERVWALDAFRRGELRAVVTSRVLHVPHADVAVVLGGFHSARAHVQQMGRLLQPLSGKRAVVYELVALDTYEVRQPRQPGERLAFPKAHRRECA